MVIIYFNVAENHPAFHKSIFTLFGFKVFSWFSYPFQVLKIPLSGKLPPKKELKKTLVKGHHRQF